MNAVLQEERTKAAYGGDSSGGSGPSSAAYSIGGGKGKGGKGRQAKGDGTKACHHCGKPGHLQKDCWNKHPEKKPKGGKGGGSKGQGPARGGSGGKSHNVFVSFMAFGTEEMRKLRQANRHTKSVKHVL